MDAFKVDRSINLPLLDYFIQDDNFAVTITATFDGFLLGNGNNCLAESRQAFGI